MQIVSRVLFTACKAHGRDGPGVSENIPVLPVCLFVVVVVVVVVCMCVCVCVCVR